LRVSLGGINCYLNVFPTIGFKKYKTLEITNKWVMLVVNLWGFSVKTVLTSCFLKKILEYRMIKKEIEALSFEVKLLRMNWGFG
jgi:hypothetical protein